MHFIEEKTTLCTYSMDTTAVRNYKVDMYEEVCRESRKEITESNLE